MSESRRSKGPQVSITTVQLEGRLDRTDPEALEIEASDEDPAQGHVPLRHDHALVQRLIDTEADPRVRARYRHLVRLAR